MKFNSNNQYYISLLFFLIIHAKIMTSAKIKSLGVPKDINLTRDYVNRTNIISSQNSKTPDIQEKKNLDMNNKTSIQNSFLEIKTILDQEIKPITTVSNEKHENDILNENIIESKDKNNNKIISKKPNLSKPTDSSILRINSEDELVFKLKELEAKFRENYQIEEEKYSGEQALLTAERKNSKLRNKQIDEITDKNEEIEENNSFSDELNIEEFFNIKSEKKKYLEEHNVFMFYNSLSLVMLSMLGGGVIGIIFILYFSYKDENHKL